ncbi:MAG: hypothetical protein LUQ01_05945 [Methanolinea sp.]|nr:hypothetical protein [Methanolinea sp.]
MEFILVLFAIPLLTWGISVVLDRALLALEGCPCRIPVPPMIGALAVFLAWTIAGLSAGSPAGPLVSVVLFVLIAVILASAIVTPAPLLDTVFRRRSRIGILCIASVLTIPFLFALLLNPESRVGGPLPLLADRLPLLGGVFDLIMDAVPLAAAFGFEPVFSAFLYAGIYLEIFIVTVILFLLVRLFSNRFPPEEDGTGPGR